MTIETKTSVVATQRGWDLEFNDYVVSFRPANDSHNAHNAAYAALHRLAKSVDFADNVSYDDLTKWAESTVRLQNINDPEANDYMLSDVWGWYDCWNEAADRAFGSEFAKFVFYPDHFGHAVSGGIEFKSNRFDCDGYTVEVNRR